MGSWLLKTSFKRQTKQKSTNQQTKKSRKIKSVGNITPTTDHYPSNG